MSDEVVVAIITTSGTVLVALIGVLLHKRKTQRQRNSVPQAVLTTAASIPKAIQGQQTDSPRRMIDLSHTKISNVIESVPPLQRDAVAASFIGAYVQWRGTLFAASRRDDIASIALDAICERGGLVHCTAASHESDALLVATEGTEVIVKGRIARVSKHEANSPLKNVAADVSRLQFSGKYERTHVRCYGRKSF